MPERPASGLAALVRRLVPEDASELRELRLEALRLHPGAFGSTHAVEAAEPVSAFAARIAGGCIFGGFIAGRMRGMAGFSVVDAAQLRHKGVLGGMYVRESARGSGLADAIVRAVLTHAAARVEQVLLTVAADNGRAIRFYQRQGFVAYGTEPRALKVGARYLDELLMVHFIRAPVDRPAPPPHGA
ncbi:MAG: GNAT family N-acetyltransferase [Geminicoccaceae bacterium]